jgi:hypothetical protein
VSGVPPPRRYVPDDVSECERVGCTLSPPSALGVEPRCRRTRCAPLERRPPTPVRWIAAAANAKRNAALRVVGPLLGLDFNDALQWRYPEIAFGPRSSCLRAKTGCAGSFRRIADGGTSPI